MSKLTTSLLKNIKASYTSVEEEVRNEDAPRNIIEAAQAIDRNVKVGLAPSVGLVQYVQRWLMRKRENNRFGK